jgi:hypothetical protein
MAFCECSSLKNVILPDGLDVIYNFAFASCPALSSIIIPESVIWIVSYAFEGCDSLTIYVRASSEPETWDPNWNNDSLPVIWGYAE